jgi:putative ABC transport system permease protein
LEREANLTWTSQLPDGNKIVSGEWWRDNDQGGPRMSVEKGIANVLHLKLGDRVTYDVSGELITATVANFREVQWDNFRPNFFIVFSPGVIDHAAGTYITSMHVPSAKRAVMRDFTRQFPEVTAIDIDAVITQVRSVMDKVNLAVEYVFLFTLFAGITVLFAAIQSTRDERRYESAMLRTLGASRRVVLQGVAAEFVVLGMLAGVMAATGASIAGYLLTQLMNLEYSFDPTVWIAGLVAGVALVGITGTAVTYSVVNAPPVETLRRGV